MHMVLQMLLEREGMSEEDLCISNVRVRDMPAAMASGGQFDAVLGWEPGMQRIVQGGHGYEVITARQIEDMAQITYPFILSATKEYVAANPDVIQSVVNAYAKAHKFVRDHPDDAVAIFKPFLDGAGGVMDVETVRYMMFDTDRFGGVAYTDRDMTDLVSTVDFLKRTRGGMDNMPAIENSIIPEFGNKAEEAIM
jgi:ABC-type nitrate/sulfonate/bicarbonate transport system substrate-binding protein